MTLTKLSADIPVGDVEFYDNFVPALAAGNWRIEVDQTVAKAGQPVNTAPLGTKQYFVVSAPQVHLDQNAIISRYPPNNTTGKYGEVLAHVVLGDPMLPWERAMTSSGDRQPWLALLVLRPDELIGATGSATRLTGATVDDFLGPATGVLLPSLTIEDDIDPSTQACNYIEISTATFVAVAPRLDELRFLAHCRQVNTGDKPILGLDERGLFSVVVGNRFPAQPAAGQPPAKTIVHLVSLEGFEPYLVDSPSFDGKTSVRLLTLASWTFSTLADNAEDFRGLVDGLVASELDGGSYDPGALWLRAPLPTLGQTGDAASETQRRITDGFVPLTYHTRVGAESFAWYRGPLTPVFTTALDRTTPFTTSDAALIYDQTWGVFDTSLATAFQIGRAVALSDKQFGKQLLEFRKQTHRLTDNLLYRLRSEHFSASQIQSVTHDSLVQDEFTQLLDQQLLDDIGQGTPAGSGTTPAVDSPAPPQDPKQAVQEFLAEPEVLAALQQLVAADLDPIARWLARLMLLYPVPFNYLVAEPEMLPVESLRFFYLDRNWIAALLDGALTLGMESSRDTFYYQMTHGVLHDAARTAASFERQHLTGAPPSQPELDEDLVSGFLLRSALVSGWPNLAVRPRKGGQPLEILRMDHLANNVLLCLMAGVPDEIEFSEPQEGFRFGVDDDGAIPLRTLTQDAPDLGKQLANDPTLAVYDPSGAKAELTRGAGSGVLNIAPSSKAGLIQSIQTNNTTAGTLGPGAFAIQMVKSPEAILFHSATAGQGGGKDQ